MESTRGRHAAGAGVSDGGGKAVRRAFSRSTCNQHTEDVEGEDSCACAEESIHSPHIFLFRAHKQRDAVRRDVRNRRTFPKLSSHMRRQKSWLSTSLPIWSSLAPFSPRSIDTIISTARRNRDRHVNAVEAFPRI
jgi:hypothetical protein